MVTEQMERASRVEGGWSEWGRLKGRLGVPFSRSGPRGGEHVTAWEGHTATKLYGLGYCLSRFKMIEELPKYHCRKTTETTTFFPLQLSNRLIICLTDYTFV
jgi:hypothetical protein